MIAETYKYKLADSNYIYEMKNGYPTVFVTEYNNDSRALVILVNENVDEQTLSYLYLCLPATLFTHALNGTISLYQLARHETTLSFLLKHYMDDDTDVIEKVHFYGDRLTALYDLDDNFYLSTPLCM